jgi:hypothetical protein
MDLLAETKANQDAIYAAKELCRAYNDAELGSHFIARTLDQEFERVGQILMRHKNQQADHKYVWIGYELARNEFKSKGKTQRGW